MTDEYPLERDRRLLFALKEKPPESPPFSPAELSA